MVALTDGIHIQATYLSVELPYTSDAQGTEKSCRGPLHLV